MPPNTGEALPLRPAPRPRITKVEKEATELLLGSSSTGKDPKHPKINEDTIYADPERGIGLVADGMGGGVASDMASETAAKMFIPSALEQHTLDLQSPTGLPAEDTPEAKQQRDAAYFQAKLINSVFNSKRDTVKEQPVVESAVRAMLTYMNDRVNALRSDPKIIGQAQAKADELQKIYGGGYTAASLLRGFGSTASLMKFWRDEHGADRVTVGNVGDSRIYRLRKGTLDRLTRDDSFVQAIIEEGVKDTLGEPILDDNDVRRRIDLQDLEAKAALRPELERCLYQIRLEQEAARARGVQPLPPTIESIRHVILQYLGMPNQEDFHPFVDTVDAEDGDVFIEVSDNLCDNLTDDEIETIARKNADDPVRLVRELQDAAYKRGHGEKTVPPLEPRLRARAKVDDSSVVAFLFRRG